MKGKDIQIIILVAGLSLFASILLSGVFFSTTDDRSQSVETAEPITDTFLAPDDRYFNNTSFNPAKEVEVGADPASNPFRGN